MTTLAKFMIIAGADNHPPRLEKSLYDWLKSRMELYIENRENGRMILNSLQNGPLVWPTVVEVDGTARTKKYEELSVAENFQADCDLKATNIVLQGLPPDVYAIINQHKVAKEIWDGVKLLMQGTKLSLQEKECLAVPMFNQGDDPIVCLNKAMAFLTAVASSRFPSTNNQLKTSSNLRNQATIQDGREGRQWWLNAIIVKTKDLDAYDSDCDDVSNAKAVLMANLSSYGSDVISEVPYHEPYHTDMDNQSVHAMQGFKQTPVVNFTDNEITSNRNIILYSQYLQETQQTAILDTNLYAQQDSMILSVFEQMSEQMINYEIDSLEQNLYNQIKEMESLLQIFTVFKNVSKEKENKYMDKEIDLEKKIKELDNIVYKVGQFAQTVHMLTKPQVSYDDTHKQALGYRNLFYLKKSQRIKPILYDGSVISTQHVASLVIDDKETLILEEVSRSKMLAKQNNPMSKEKKVNTTPINYVELNRLSEDFGKCFVPQQELSDEQAFWLQTSHLNTDQSSSSPVKIEAPKELSKVSLVNTSFKKLRCHLGQFDIVVKKQITPDAITKGE
ncbi:hypothetical protein Tco_1235423 [Tanacetum coccineum]